MTLYDKILSWWHYTRFRLRRTSSVRTVKEPVINPCPICGKRMKTYVETNKSDGEIWITKWCTPCEHIENKCITCKGRHKND